jgi:hypothetical protein
MRISLGEGRLRPRVLPKAERVRCPRAGGYGPFPGGLGIILPALGPAREVLHWTGTGAARVTPVERRALLARKGGQRIVRSGRVPYVDGPLLARVGSVRIEAIALICPVCCRGHT